MTIMFNTEIDFIPQIQSLLIEIGTILEKVERLPSKKPQFQLRKQNQIKSIFSTCRIEGNKLKLDEVTAILEGKRVKGNKDQILEIKNAKKLYDLLEKLNPESEMDFLLGHNVLMSGLIDSSGSYRKEHVGIASNGEVKTVFPDPQKVNELCKHLFNYIAESKDHYLVKSAIIHYLIESIHPFVDGNGRIGRFWQMLYLSANNDIFSFLPLENLIRKAQQDYYDALFIGNKANSPTLFVKFILEIVKESLNDSLRYKYDEKKTKKEMRYHRAEKELQGKEFTRREYLIVNSDISEAQATKDLTEFVNDGLLEKTGDTKAARYRF